MSAFALLPLPQAYQFICELLMTLHKVLEKKTSGATDLTTCEVPSCENFHNGAILLVYHAYHTYHAFWLWPRFSSEPVILSVTSVTNQRLVYDRSSPGGDHRSISVCIPGQRRGLIDNHRPVVEKFPPGGLIYWTIEKAPAFSFPIMFIWTPRDLW